MRRFKIQSTRFLLAISLLLNPYSQSADAAQLESCKLPISERQVVSLGFPISKDRLKTGISNIYVIPYKLTDSANFQLNENQRLEFKTASKLISVFSNNQANVNFEIMKTINSDISTDDIRNILLVRNQGWNEKDESKSTWGILRKLFAIAEKEFDLTSADSVIFVGSSTTPDTYFAEAMMFDSTNDLGFRRPLITKQHKILNAILLDAPKSGDLIAHETLHNFGLTDLYGQRIPSGLSIMGTGGNKLLNYEKWVLGWFPDSKVQCFDDSIVSTSSIREIKLNNQQEGALVIIKTGRDTAYMIESSRNSQNGGNLVFYSFKMDDRPPITFHSLNLGLTPYFPLIDDTSSIGSELESSNYNLLLSDVDNLSINLRLIPNNLKNSEEASQLRVQSIKNQKAAAEKARAIKTNYEDAYLTLKRIQSNVASWFTNYPEVWKTNPELKVRLQRAFEYVYVPNPVQSDYDRLRDLLAGNLGSSGLVPDSAIAQLEITKIETTKAKAAKAQKVITISCFKGKLTKKITGVNPKCPASYKQK